MKKIKTNILKEQGPKLTKNKTKNEHFQSRIRIIKNDENQ